MVRISRAATVIAMFAGPAAAQDVMVFEGATASLGIGPGQVISELAPQDDATAALTLSLGSAQAEAFANFTEAQIGRQVALVICGTEVLRAVVRTRIEGGLIQTPQLPMEQAEAAHSALNSAMGCPG